MFIFTDRSACSPTHAKPNRRSLSLPALASSPLYMCLSLPPSVCLCLLWDPASHESSVDLRSTEYVILYYPEVCCDVLSRPRIASHSKPKTNKKTMCHEEAKHDFKGTLGRLTSNRPTTKAQCSCETKSQFMRALTAYAHATRGEEDKPFCKRELFGGTQYAISSSKEFI